MSSWWEPCLAIIRSVILCWDSGRVWETSLKTQSAHITQTPSGLKIWWSRRQETWMLSYSRICCWSDTHWETDPESRVNRLSPVSYTHLRAHETKANLVCRLLLEKKKKQN